MTTTKVEFNCEICGQRSGERATVVDVPSGWVTWRQDVSRRFENVETADVHVCPACAKNVVLHKDFKS